MLTVNSVLVHAAVERMNCGIEETQQRDCRCRTRNVGKTDVYKPGTQNSSCLGNQKLGRKGHGHVFFFHSMVEENSECSGLLIGPADL